MADSGESVMAHCRRAVGGQPQAPWNLSAGAVSLAGAGYHTDCLPCHNVRGKETAQRLYGGSREDHLRRRYGIGQAEFADMLAEQGGVCAICGAADPQHVDHDHRAGWVRGILCFNCNGGLGQFRDTPEFLAGAITYLKGTTWQRVLIHPGVFQMCSPTRGRPPSRSS